MATFDQVASELERQAIELPSWAFGNSGTRFKVFAQRGVPALAFRAGRDLRVGGLAAGQRIVGAYNARCYHQPCDQFDPRWNFAGTAQEALAAYRVGQLVADSRDWPGWLPGAPWAAAREASAAERR